MKPERGQYRSITVVLLDGPDFQELPAEARWVFVCLKCSLGPCGIQVEYPAALVEKLSHRTGYAQAIVASMLDLLQVRGWVRAERNIVWVVGQLQAEPWLSPRNANHRPTVLSHIKGLPRLGIVGDFIRFCRDYFDEPDALADAYPKPTGPTAIAFSHPTPYPLPNRMGDGMGDGMGDHREGEGRPRTEEVAVDSLNQPAGRADDAPARRADDDPTNGQIMGAIRRVLYAPDGKPPAEWDEAREFSIMVQLRKRGHCGAQILHVVEGLGYLKRDGVVDWLQPDGKATLRAVYHSRSGVLDMWNLAADAYYREGSRNRPKRSPAELRRGYKGAAEQARRSGPLPISELIPEAAVHASAATGGVTP